MEDSTNDAVPLTPLVVDVVTFDRAPLGRRGYNEDQVDEYLDRIQAALAGTDNLTAQEVREVVFDAAPLIRRGYHEDQVDNFLDLVVAELDGRERNRSASARAAQRQHTPRPAARTAAPPADASEQTSPVLPKLPAEQPQPKAAASNPSFPPAASPSFPPASAATPSFPAASASSPSFRPAGEQTPGAYGTHTPRGHAPDSQTTGTHAFGSHAARPAGTQPPPPTPGRGPLTLPLPPTPPDERGYHPADVARLVALLTEPTEPPSSAAITGMRMNRMDVGHGYHAGAVDAMRAIWITELRRRGL